MQITININNATETPTVSVEQHFDAAPAADPIPRIVSAFPTRMDDEARRALWAAWHEAFDRDDRAARFEFTRKALGLTVEDNVSWSRDGSLTSDQAYHMVRLLKVISDIL